MCSNTEIVLERGKMREGVRGVSHTVSVHLSKPDIFENKRRLQTSNRGRSPSKETGVLIPGERENTRP